MGYILGPLWFARQACLEKRIFTSFEGFFFFCVTVCGKVWRSLWFRFRFVCNVNHFKSVQQVAAGVSDQPLTCCRRSQGGIVALLWSCLEQCGVWQEGIRRQQRCTNQNPWLSLLWKKILHRAWRGDDVFFCPCMQIKMYRNYPCAHLDHLCTFSCHIQSLFVPKSQPCCEFYRVHHKNITFGEQKLTLRVTVFLFCWESS